MANHIRQARLGLAEAVRKAEKGKRTCVQRRKETAARAFADAKEKNAMACVIYTPEVWPRHQDGSGKIYRHEPKTPANAS